MSSERSGGTATSRKRRLHQAACPQASGAQRRSVDDGLVAEGGTSASRAPRLSERR